MGACQSNQYSQLQRITEARQRTFQGCTRMAKITHVYDGDTVTILTNLTNKEPYYEYSFRLIGIDTPEMKPSLGIANRALHIDAARRIKDILKEQLLDKRNGMVYIDFSKEEKYGRLLGTVWTIKKKKIFGIKCGSWQKDVNVNNWLLSNQLALPYTGGTKSEFKEQFLVDIMTRYCEMKSTS